jgi:hypothetical protein
MYRYPDGTFKRNAPARVELDGFRRTFTDLTREERDGLGYNEAVPLVRDPFTAYETAWEKGSDLVYRETAVSAVVDETARLTALAATIRATRDGLLAECDFTQLQDAPLTPTQQAEWQVYRERLRDVPEQAGFPDEVTWPGKPVG